MNADFGSDFSCKIGHHLVEIFFFLLLLSQPESTLLCCEAPFNVPIPNQMCVVAQQWKMESLPLPFMPHAVAGFLNSLSTSLGGTVNTFPKRFGMSTAVFTFAGKGTQELLS